MSDESAVAARVEVLRAKGKEHRASSKAQRAMTRLNLTRPACASAIPSPSGRGLGRGLSGDENRFFFLSPLRLKLRCLTPALSPRERERDSFSFRAAVSPLPSPLPKGEGARATPRQSADRLLYIKDNGRLEGASINQEAVRGNQ